MRILIFLLLPFTAFSAFAGNVGTIKTFTPNELLRSIDLNNNNTTQNFAINDNNTRLGVVESTLAIQGSATVIESISIIERFVVADGVATVACLVGEVSIGGGSRCLGLPSANEAGYLYADTQIGDTWIGGCYPVSALNLTTPIEVSVNCMTVTAVNAVTTLAVPASPVVNQKAIDAENQLQLQYSQQLEYLKSLP